MNRFASIHGSLGGRVAALDSGAGGFGESVEAGDEVGVDIGLGDSLEESSLLDLGVGLVGNSDVSLCILSDEAVIDDDLAEAFSDLVRAYGGSETDESDQQN